MGRFNINLLLMFDHLFVSMTKPTVLTLNTYLDHRMESPCVIPIHT